MSHMLGQMSKHGDGSNVGIKTKVGGGVADVNDTCIKIEKQESGQ